MYFLTRLAPHKSVLFPLMYCKDGINKIYQYFDIEEYADFWGIIWYVQKKVAKFYIVQLLRFSYIYWLINLKKHMIGKTVIYERRWCNWGFLLIDKSLKLPHPAFWFILGWITFQLNYENNFSYYLKFLLRCFLSYLKLCHSLFFLCCL